MQEHDEGQKVVTKYRGEGVTMEMLERFNVVEDWPKIDKNIEVTELEPDGTGVQL